MRSVLADIELYRAGIRDLRTGNIQSYEDYADKGWPHGQNGRKQRNPAAAPELPGKLHGEFPA